MTQDPRTYVPARERSPFGQFELHPTHLKTRIPGAQFRGTYVSVVPNVGPEEARSAALTACEHSRSVADAADLLAVLGLIDLVPANPEPLSCGHPRSAQRRRQNGRRGVECVECVRAAQRVRDARARKSRVAAS